MPMSITQQIRQKYRANGRYTKLFPCKACGKSAGENHNIHPAAAELSCLCRKCFDRLRGLPGPEAVKVAFGK